ncbi:MAG: pentapeptide repeat-containing protein [Brasilonema angustatum HA4187-MV1]|jgi:uncharacterized protein YjbI with pentapeptide repeats|nr:pentapeptide repeat-containing protein [Brasilonema angustatum HA4187-MV1]
MTNSPHRSKAQNSLSQLIPRRSTVKGFCLILLAFGLTSSIFIATAYWESPYKNDAGKPLCEENLPWKDYLICRVANSKVLQQVQNFSVLFAAWLFIFDTFERKKQAYREAWSLIDGARESETSGARILALNELHEDKVSLRGLDAEGADMVGINLKGAFLENANLRGSLLQRCNLIGAKLQESELQDSQLQEAKLRRADLRMAYLQRANLEKAELQGAKLGGAVLRQAILAEAQLQEADLSGADFRGANLWRAELKEADVEHANFAGAKKLDINQVKKAKNWEKATYGKDFAPELGELLSREEYTDEFVMKDKRKTSAENELFKRLVNILISTESVERKERLMLQNKLDKAMELLSGEKTVSTQDTISAELIVRDVVEELLQKNSDDNNRDLDEKLRNQLQAFQDTADIAIQNVDKRQKFESIASEWLKLKCQSLKDCGIKAILTKKPEIKEAGGLLYPPEKINQLSEDIERLLNLLVESLSAHQNLSISEAMKLKLPSSVYLDIFRVIWEEIIPRCLDSESEQISDEVLERLKIYFLLLRDELKKIKSL